MLVAFLLAACSTIQPASVDPWPIDLEAAMRPDLMAIEPDPATPGRVVAITYAEPWDRGVLYAIDERVGSAWARRFMLYSDANGGHPFWFRRSDPDVAVEMVGIVGTGPDHVPIPEQLEPGNYRVCTVIGVDNVCAPVTVVEE